MPPISPTRIQILLVEDNPADVQMILMLLKKSNLNYQINTVRDGDAATNYLFDKVRNGTAERPDLIILDLNLPRKDGRQVLKEIRDAPDVSGIPILIFSTSRDQEDVCKCYELHANCYITKPSDLKNFNAVMKSVEQFWLSTAELPRYKEARRS